MASRLLPPRVQPALVLQGLRAWTRRQVAVALAGALGVGLLLGVATVLIPNPVFGRDIPPVAWNYPVWVLTAVLSGMLLATYAAGRRSVGPAGSGAGPGVGSAPAQGPDTSRSGAAGAILAWFAVGCPVCNKIALLALGYSGALTWFAPVQPVLAVLALLLLTVALAVRLQGSVHCPVPVAVAAS